MSKNLGFSLAASNGSILTIDSEIVLFLLNGFEFQF